MNTCRTCVHWVANHQEGFEDTGMCHKLTDSNLPKTQALTVYSDSDPIQTGIDFGCIHHATKT